MPFNDHYVCEIHPCCTEMINLPSLLIAFLCVNTQHLLFILVLVEVFIVRFYLLPTELSQRSRAHLW